MAAGIALQLLISPVMQGEARKRPRPLITRGTKLSLRDILPRVEEDSIIVPFDGFIATHRWEARTQQVADRWNFKEFITKYRIWYPVRDASERGATPVSEEQHVEHWDEARTAFTKTGNGNWRRIHRNSKIYHSLRAREAVINRIEDQLSRTRRR